MKKLREYTNNSLEKIGLRFEGVVPVITDEWDFFSNSKKQEKKKKLTQALRRLNIID